MPHPNPPAPQFADRTPSSYEWRIASGRDDLRAAQRLRFRVGAARRGGSLSPRLDGLDRDPLDGHAHHLLVYARGSRLPVACARLLPEEGALAGGGFPSLESFDLGPLVTLPGRGAELDRLRILPAHAGQPAAFEALWRGVVYLLQRLDCRYLIARERIPVASSIPPALAWLRAFRRVPSRQRVAPRSALPNALTIWHGTPSLDGLPPSSRAWLDLGARVAGEPAHDTRRNAACLLMLLQLRDVPERYRMRTPYIPDAAPSDDMSPGVGNGGSAARER